MMFTGCVDRQLVTDRSTGTPAHLQHHLRNLRRPGLQRVAICWRSCPGRHEETPAPPPRENGTRAACQHRDDAAQDAPDRAAVPEGLVPCLKRRRNPPAQAGDDQAQAGAVVRQWRKRSGGRRPSTAPTAAQKMWLYSSSCRRSVHVGPRRERRRDAAPPSRRRPGRARGGPAVRSDRVKPSSGLCTYVVLIGLSAESSCNSPGTNVPARTSGRAGQGQVDQYRSYEATFAATGAWPAGTSRTRGRRDQRGGAARRPCGPRALALPASRRGHERLHRRLVFRSTPAADDRADQHRPGLYDAAGQHHRGVHAGRRVDGGRRLDQREQRVQSSASGSIAAATAARPGGAGGVVEPQGVM